MAPGFGAIQDATFMRGARFADGAMSATAAVAKYGLAKGVLDLSGSEGGSPVPHVVNDQIGIDATHIELTLDGPVVKASGTVKSVLQPTKDGRKGADGKMPSMLKKDQPVNVTSDELAYDGKASRAVYTGKALYALNEWLIAQKELGQRLDDVSGGIYPVMFLHTGGTLNYSGVTLPVIES